MKPEPDPLIGKKLGTFRILERIGEGASGVVYRAHDDALDRLVALKVLRAELMADEVSRERFRREAVLSSGLSHPAIATFHALQHDDGYDYFVMEYIPGQSLAKHIARGALPKAQVLAIGKQLAEGLEAAHHHGVIHRDIKPSNVMITEGGRVKILDFGVAKWVEAREDWSKLTREDTVPGTLAYLAPESLQTGASDERSDIYSVGVLLYEAATGSVPFPGLRGTALVDAILSAPPQSPRARVPQLSRELADLIMRCLRKSPHDRPSSAAALERELERIETAPPRGLSQRIRSWFAHMSWRTAILASLAVIALGFGIVKGIEGVIGSQPIRSLAVLRFSGPSGSAEPDPYTSGLPEELVSQLSNVSSLHVVSWSSSKRPDPAKKTPREIAFELGVQGLVMGEIQLVGGKLRITAQLVDGIRDKSIWTDTYEGDTTNVPKLKDKVARAIVHEVSAKLNASERRRFAEQREVDPAAYALYLRGRYHWNRRPLDLLRAVDYFEQAIRRDSSYAAAHAGLADAWSAVGLYGLKPPLEVRGRARAAARRAVELDDRLAEAHYAMAHVFHNYDWDWDAAEMEYRRAISLNPNFAAAHHGYAHLLAQTRRLPEARLELDRALELDPVNVISTAAGGVFEYYAGRYDSALVFMHRAAELDSGSAIVHRLHAALLDRQGRSDEAIQVLARSITLQGHGPLAEAMLRAHRRAGFVAALDVLIATYIRKRESGAYEPAEHIAELLARLGRKDEAFRWLETAYLEHDTELNRLHVDPIFEPLRSDPRFTALLKRIGFPDIGS